MNEKRVPTREGVLRAAGKIADLLPPTPLLPLEIDGRTIWCKADCLQPVGAFKIRGAWHRLSDLSEEERQNGVVAVSSGNHAQGVAWAARRIGLKAVIVMPQDAPKAKLAATQGLGAEVVLYDRYTESRDDIAAELVAASGATMVHAFGDPWVIEGQGSLGIEATHQMRALGVGQPSRIVACCGGGGLSAGLALACPEADLTIVEPEGWDDVICSLASGEIQGVADMRFPTPCDALQTQQTFPINFAILKECGISGVTVTAKEIGAAMRLAFEKLHLVVEPGGAAALAAIMSGKVEAKDGVLVTLTGGNVDPQTFARLAFAGEPFILP